MMFLEYFVWGSWLPLLALYLSDVLHFTGAEIGWIFATQAIASLAALFLGGQLADRMLPAVKLLAALQAVGGVTMLLLARQTGFGPFFVLMLVYLTPQIVSLGRGLDFVPRDPAPPGMRKFWILHAVYTSLEMVKLLAGLVVAWWITNWGPEVTHF